MGSDSGISLPRVYKYSNTFFVHESQVDSIECVLDDF